MIFERPYMYMHMCISKGGPLNNVRTYGWTKGSTWQGRQGVAEATWEQWSMEFEI